MPLLPYRHPPTTRTAGPPLAATARSSEPLGRELTFHATPVRTAGHDDVKRSFKGGQGSPRGAPRRPRRSLNAKTGPRAGLTSGSPPVCGGRDVPPADQSLPYDVLVSQECPMATAIRLSCDSVKRLALACDDRPPTTTRRRRRRGRRNRSDFTPMPARPHPFPSSARISVAEWLQPDGSVERGDGIPANRWWAHVDSNHGPLPYQAG